MATKPSTYVVRPKALGHVMLDLETMGNSSNSVIASIGAVEFDIKTGETGREFYERIDIQSCLNAGLVVNGSTIKWWLGQSDAARAEICKAGDGLRNVLEKFKSFMGCLDKVEIWGNGARFDIGILEDAYKATYDEVILPWDFRMERDVRTLVSFAPNIKEHYPFTGTTHNPIDDCKHQIGYCSAIWQKLNTN